MAKKRIEYNRLEIGMPIDFCGMGFRVLMLMQASGQPFQITNVPTICPPLQCRNDGGSQAFAMLKDGFVRFRVTVLVISWVLEGLWCLFIHPE